MLDSSGFVVLDESYDPKCTAKRVERVLSALKDTGRHRKCQEMERFCHVYQPIKEKCAADKDLVHEELSAALVQHLKEENTLSRGQRGRRALLQSMWCCAYTEGCMLGALPRELMQHIHCFMEFEDSTMTVQLLRMLHVLTRKNENVTAILHVEPAEESVVHQVTEAMKLHSDVPLVLGWGCATLINLVYRGYRFMKETLLNTDTLPLFVNTLSRFPEHTLVQMKGCHVCKNILSHKDELSAVLVEHGILQRFLHTLTAFSSDDRVAREALFGTMNVLSSTAEARAQCVQVGLYKAIIDLIPLHLEDMEFSEWILHVLRTGTCKGEVVQEEMLKLGFVERASKVFTRWPTLQPYKRAFETLLAITWPS